MPVTVSTLVVRADMRRVWEALTDPALVKQWQFGSDLLTDWEVGSDIRFVSVWEDKVFEQWGKVLEMIPGRLIRYSLFAPSPGIEDKPENYFVMSYRLHPEGDERVRLEIVHEDNRPLPLHGAEETESENPVLAALKKLVEGKEG